MKIVKSTIVPVRRRDIDTDLIIPAEFLRTIGRDGLGKYLFVRIKGELRLDDYKGAEIMVSYDNFGCGSSREHAVWALKDWGIEVIIAPSFSDIFYSNAVKNGILPVVLGSKIVDRIFDVVLAHSREWNYEVTVDLPAQKVILPDRKNFKFEIDPYHKECLIKDMNDLDYLLKNMTAIKKFDKEHSKYLFFNLSQL